MPQDAELVRAPNPGSAAWYVLVPVRHRSSFILEVLGQERSTPRLLNVVPGPDWNVLSVPDALALWSPTDPDRVQGHVGLQEASRDEAADAIDRAVAEACQEALMFRGVPGNVDVASGEGAESV